MDLIKTYTDTHPSFHPKVAFPHSPVIYGDLVETLKPILQHIWGYLMFLYSYFNKNNVESQRKMRTIILEKRLMFGFQTILWLFRDVRTFKLDDLANRKDFSIYLLENRFFSSTSRHIPFCLHPFQTIINRFILFHFKPHCLFLHLNSFPFLTVLTQKPP